MILFDGCSWTWGDELENREQDAFPHVVARMGLMREGITRDHVNLGQCGKSNDGILRTTLDYCEKHPVNVAVIQFTLISRREVMRETENKYYHITPHAKDIRSIEYYNNLHTRQDDCANYYKNKFILENYFKSKNIRYYFVNLTKPKDALDFQNSTWYDLCDKKPLTSLKSIVGRMKTNPENYVTGHPNKRGHELIAKHIYENIF